MRTANDRGSMKQLILSLVSFGTLFLQSAQAWCPSHDFGSSELFNVSIYAVSGCDPNDRFANGTVIIEFWPKKNGEITGEKLAVSFDSECKWSANRQGFSCNQDGISPLAGTRYVITKDLKDKCDDSSMLDRFTCKDGCDGVKAPRHLGGSEQFGC